MGPRARPEPAASRPSAARGRAQIVGHWVALDLRASGVPPDVSTDLAPGLSPEQAGRDGPPARRADSPGDYLLILDIVTPERGSLAAAGIDPTIIRVHVEPKP